MINHILIVLFFRNRTMSAICFVCNLPIMSHQVGLGKYYFYILLKLNYIKRAFPKGCFYLLKCSLEFIAINGGPFYRLLLHHKSFSFKHPFQCIPYEFIVASIILKIRFFFQVWSGGNGWDDLMREQVCRNKSRWCSKRTLLILK